MNRTSAWWLPVWVALVVGVLCLIIALVVGGLFFYVRGHAISDAESARLIGNGEVINGALQAYRASNGSYPDTLARLVPDHLESIPGPEWGVGEWEYVRQLGGGSYTLNAPRYKSDYQSCYYNSVDGEWWYDQ